MKMTYLDRAIDALSRDQNLPAELRIDAIRKLNKVRQHELARLRSKPCQTCNGSGRVQLT